MKIQIIDNITTKYSVNYVSNRTASQPYKLTRFSNPQPFFDAM